MESKLKYLEKYGFSTDDNGDKKKKKKKKSKVKDVGGLKIIDQNDFPYAGESKSKSGRGAKNEPTEEVKEAENEALELMTTQEELPQVAGVVDDSRLRTKFTTGGFKNAFRKAEDDIKREPLSEAEEEESEELVPRQQLRRSRHDSDSPPPVRRKRHDSSDGEDKTEKINTERRRRHDSEDDRSPPRRQRHDTDISPTRIKQEPDSDASPPRKADKSDSDASPPRRLPNVKQEPAGSDSDISPPRIKQEPDDDLSPPRKLMKTTLDGKKAGLQDARSMKVENEERRKKESKMLDGLSSEVSGRGAKTKIRGRLKDKEEEEKIAKERAELVRKDMEAKYARWNKGVKQIENQKAQINSDLHEMDKPLARDKNDQDLDAHLKNIERSEDPMLKYMQKQKKKTHSNLPQYPEYKGTAPPNRFGLRPGYRWDGVDRSTGFEKKLFESKNSRKALAHEAHMWSTEDM